MKTLILIGIMLWLFLVCSAPQQYANIKSKGKYNEAERYQQLTKQNKILNQIQYD